SGWKMVNSPKYYCKVYQPGFFYPDKTFKIKNVKVEQYIYIRLVEVDWGAPNDQIIKPFIDNAGSKIDDGTWDTRIFISTNFIFKSLEASTRGGDQICMTIVNIGPTN
ncbi:MAG: hypothetical protein ACTSX6_04210, partial [Candidatus Heimdallarchaeaceae archaeon]